MSTIDPRGRRGAYRVPKGALDRHVPIRFNAEVIDQAKEIAERDGLTVSSWIRRLVERELDNHQPSNGPGTRNAAEHTARATWKQVI